jgi:hypothetical protein
MDDLLIHLICSEPRDQAEVDRLFELDQELDDAFPHAYEGNEIGAGEFVIHLRHRNADSLLAAIRPRLREDLVQPGSHVVIRRTQKDEVTERVVPLVGKPRLPAQSQPTRKAISFGGIFDETRVNKAVCEHLHRLWPRVLMLPACGDEAAQIAILWWIAGDISPAPVKTMSTRLESTNKRALTVRVPIHQQERSVREVDALVRDSLKQAIEQCERLVKRRGLDWDLQPARDAIVRIVETND